jgi:hypothetical protein
MYTIKLIKILPSTACIILTWAPYSEGEVENVIIENIKNMILEVKKKSEIIGEASYNAIVENIHNIFLQNGNRSEYKQLYKRDSFKWYMAYSELLFINAYNHDGIDYFEYAYIGQIPIYQYDKQNNKIESVNYIHNIKNEVDSDSIEESCLTPFHSRSNEEIAKQIIPCESNQTIEMVANCDRETFINNKLSHSLSRNIGFFQKANSNEVPDYRIDSPKVTYGFKILPNENEVAIYIPENKDIIPFSQDKLNEIAQTKFYNKVSSNQAIGNCYELKKGDLVTINITGKDISIKVLV